MKKTSVMRIPKNRSTSKRLNKKTLLFQILSQEPNLSAQQLQRQAKDAGIQINILAAYRALRAFRESSGKLENSDTRCLRIVSTILQDAIPGEHLTATEIQNRAFEQNCSIHQATVYRVLARLTEIGLVLAFEKGRKKFYEWKREEEHHGHLTCIECGNTIEFHQDYLDEIGRQISLRFGYDFARIEFIVRSICEPCRQKHS
jgi:Fur family ferric uptake transcriptional regulator